ncbi:hydantoinase B/oxoprolinase family protein [Amycolatopsis rubida]|uniref:Hydantoinase B/oxoprolinase family protein n=1 Tax=Amycolatopsis rubida TaxID=112413 RepID=A0ABX0BTA7_9PSEU|nr:MULTISPECIES: hydantoinase B/oxoprolinase family protein [Amycolatopsis]MYW93619.1 hydantoinase B/oxoprolinase family protein [Amycolatopsis rubida]NEC58606.1 hydantoinase B/oxoprolinase family protein [Amycolatopsis rubida]OAP22695.1 Acetophenone carboxylase delta subunit [Amycolatopsis sp. M39]
MTPQPAQPLPPGFDPVTLEVIRMRLDSIVEEMGIAMIRSSGSPVITEAGDFNTALFDPAGRIYAYSDYVQFHIGSGSVAVQNLVKAIEGEPLAPGDAFICNDPHTAGASHPPDTNVISPIFHGDELIGWAQSQAHLVDVGGMTPGGFAPGALDCYAEALRLPPGVKIFERGEPVEWVRRILLNNVRVPALFWNDVRSLVASNNTGIRRLLGTIGEFGLDRFRDYTRLSFELAEQVVRERIAQIPDGTYTAEEWTEHNGHVDGLYRVACTMTKRENQITFDFSGSSEQTGGFVNCSYGALVGSVATAVVPILAWDVPFNEGVMTAFDIVAEPGSIVNPRPPAPISNGHLTTGARVSRLVTKLMNDACRASADEVVRARTQGGWGDSWTGGISAGTAEDGEYFVLFNMDGGGMGAGAQPDSDGLDCAGMMTQVNNMLPDVEMNEMLYPVLYLWKQLNIESAGHGAHRGGLGLRFAWTLHGAREVTQTVFAPSAQVTADGFGGGLPGGGSGHEVWRGTDVAQLLRDGRVPTREALSAAERELLAINQQSVTIRSGDVFVEWIAGGGGYGDPLLRDPQLVAADVRNGYVTAEVAAGTYGVLVQDGVADETATERARAALREQRLGEAPGEQVSSAAAAGSSAPRRDPDGWYVPASGARLGSGDDWRDSARKVTHVAAERLAAHGVRVRPREHGHRVLIDEFYSPSCGTLLDARIRVEAVAR